MNLLSMVIFKQLLKIQIFKDMHDFLHLLGLCGENHPSFLSFLMSHNEINDSIEYLKLRFRK